MGEEMSIEPAIACCRLPKGLGHAARADSNRLALRAPLARLPFFNKSWN
jgi:hypothetical protein